MQSLVELFNDLDKYANPKAKIPFMYSHMILKINKKKISQLNDIIIRERCINKLAEHLMNYEKAEKLEAGIFEYALLYVYENNFNDELAPTIYNEKYTEIMENLDPSSPVYNPALIKMENIQKTPFLKPYELNPSKWQDIFDKMEKREYFKNNMATTDIYKCRKCHENKGFIRQLQTKSIDEPMTTFYTCLICKQVQKV